MTTASTTSRPDAYRARATPVGKAVAWRLDGETLVEEGIRIRRFPLAELRSVNLWRETRGLMRRMLRLDFGPGRIVRIPSLSFELRPTPEDRTAAFSAFARELLFAASRAAPHARYFSGESRFAQLYLGAAGILAVGLALTLLAAVVANAAALGIELAARLSFVLLLMAAAWPWIGAAGVRLFDPRRIPTDLLP